MIPGIDPKIDIAFKKVFGSEPWRELTAALINAVLEPPPHQRLVDVLDACAAAGVSGVTFVDNSQGEVMP